MIKKLLIITVLLSLVVFFLVNGGQEFLSFDSLKQNKEELLTYADANFWQAFFITGGIYILTAVLNLPSAAIMSLAIGFYFWSMVWRLISKFCINHWCGLSILVSPLFIC